MKLTNLKNVHPLIMEFIKSQEYEPNPNRIGVTTLISPPLVRQLKFKFYKFLETDASERLWSCFGSMFHAQMEKCKIPGWVYETRLNWQPNPKGPEIVGYVDAYSFIMRELADFKVTSVWSVIYGLKDGKPDWEQQDNIYAYLMGLSKMPVKKVNNILILRDWQASKSEQEKDYPDSPFYTYDIKLWELKQAEEFIRHRLDLHMKPAKECMDEEKWKRPTTYAAKKKANKTASGGKVTENLSEAEEFIKQQKNPEIWEIETRPGSCQKCEKYCQVRTVCPFSPCFNKELYDKVTKKAK